MYVPEMVLGLIGGNTPAAQAGLHSDVIEKQIV
jgi:hypothetical protein